MQKECIWPKGVHQSKKRTPSIKHKERNKEKGQKERMQVKEVTSQKV